MGLIGDLVVRLKIDDKQFRDGIAKSENKIKKFSKFILSAAGIAGAIIVFSKLISVGKELVNAFVESEKSQIKLKAALMATGNAVGITVDEMNDYATELSNLTGIDDDAITGAQALMTTFTQIGKETFPTAIEAAADMSVMFGQDLQQSVIQLGTALNDPIAGVGRLKRIGISFTEDQRASIKTFVEQNDIMSAQGVILKELNVEFGGVAKAVGGTAIGSLNRYNVAMGNIKEEGGKKLLEVLAPLLDSLTENLVLTLKNWKATANLNKALKGEATSHAEVERAIRDQNERLVEAREDEIRLGKEINDLNAKMGEGGRYAIEQRNAEVLQKKRLQDLAKEEIAGAPAKLAFLEEELELMGDINVVSAATVDLGEAGTDVVKEQNIALEEHITILEALSVAAAELRDIEIEEAEAAKKAIEKKLESMQEMAEYIAGPFIDAYSAGFEALGESMVEGGNALQIFREAFKDTIAGMLKMLGKWLIVKALEYAIPWPNPMFSPPAAVLSAAGAAAAFTAAGVVTALKEGGIVTQPTLALIGEAGPEKVTPLGAEPTHITVMLGSKVLYDDITKGIKNRQIRIEQTL